jgi:hypothetical protein
MMPHKCKLSRAWFRSLLNGPPSSTALPPVPPPLAPADEERDNEDEDSFGEFDDDDKENEKENVPPPPVSTPIRQPLGDITAAVATSSPSVPTSNNMQAAEDGIASPALRSPRVVLGTLHLPPSWDGDDDDDDEEEEEEEDVSATAPSSPVSSSQWYNTVWGSNVELADPVEAPLEGSSPPSSLQDHSHSLTPGPSSSGLRGRRHQTLHQRNGQNTRKFYDDCLRVRTW